MAMRTEKVYYSADQESLKYSTVNRPCLRITPHIESAEEQEHVVRPLPVDAPAHKSCKQQSWMTRAGQVARGVDTC